MIEIIVAAGGLASPGSRLAVEKHKGKMAREWHQRLREIVWQLL